LYFSFSPLTGIMPVAHSIIKEARAAPITIKVKYRVSIIQKNTSLPLINFLYAISFVLKSEVRINRREIGLKKPMQVSLVNESPKRSIDIPIMIRR
jgi:hypothetical protein